MNLRMAELGKEYIIRSIVTDDEDSLGIIVTHPDLGRSYKKSGHNILQ